MNSYIVLLVSVAHPSHGLTVNRYCVGISTHDSRMRGFDPDRWAEPFNRKRLLSLLCEDWLTDGCSVVGCEEIAGAVQWEDAIPCP